MNSLPELAFLGIGLMGQPMAIRLLKAGYRLSAWNRTRSKAASLIPHGANIAEHPVEALARADIVITMLESGPSVAQVLEMALQGAKRGAVFVDMSSTKQAEAQALAARLDAQGMGFVDAPVSGGVLGAEAGNLAIMAGGSASDFARVEAVLLVLGRPSLVGPVGCGQLAKLCNQLIVGATLNIVAEALLLAQAGGADPALVRAALRGGFAESRILEIHGQRMLERNFLPGGQVKSQAKDMENVMSAATAAGLHLPISALVTDAYRSILANHPHADQSAALLGLESQNPGLRLGGGPDILPD